MFLGGGLWRKLVFSVLLFALTAVVGARAQGGPFHLRVVPQGASIPQGASRSFFFERTGIHESTQGILYPSAQWSSSNPGVATVNPATGLVTASSVGSATITAVSGPFRGSTKVTVTPVALISVTVTPANNTIAIAGQQTFTATGNYSDSSTLDVSAAAAWSSSLPAVATISSPGGVATGVADGNTTITATFQGFSGKTGLNVGLTALAVTPKTPTIAQGKLQPFTAIGSFTDAVQRNVSDTVTWSSSAPPVAVISNLGVAVAVGAGQSTIMAASGASSDTAMLTVTAPPALQAIAVSPPMATILQGHAKQFSAVGDFSDGSTKALSGVAWFSSNPAVVSIDFNGLASAVQPGGPATVTAIFGGISGSAQVTVSPPPSLTSITVSPAMVTLSPGTQQHYLAIGQFSDNSTKDLTTQVAWNSSVTTVATINSSGVASVVGIGSTNITASLGAVTSPAAMLNSVIAPRFLFIANIADGTVSTYGLNPSAGLFIPLSYVFVGAGSAPGTVLPDPAGRFLYVNTPGGGDSILGFKIDFASGNLSPIAFSTGLTNLGSQGQTMAIDPTGRYLFLAGVADINIYGFSIDQTTGALTPLPGSPVSGQPAYSLSFDPAGKFLYAAGANDDVAIYSFNAVDGSLTLLGTTPQTLSTPVALTFDQAGKFLFVADLGSNKVSVFTHNSVNGSLSEVAGSPFPTGNNPAALAVHPSGDFLYVANSAANDVSAFSINSSTGALTELTALGSPFAAGMAPIGMVMDPTGQGIGVIMRDSNEIWGYGINANGSLSSPFQVRTRSQPVSVAIGNGFAIFAKSPRFAFAADNTGFAIDAFVVDPVTGILTPAPGAPVPALNGQGFSFQPHSATPDPSASHLFVTDQSNQQVWTYNIDAVSGAVTQSALPPVPLGAGVLTPWFGAVDPSGRFLYVADEGSSQLSAFSIDPATGQLTPLTALGSPYATGSSPQNAVFDPTGRFLYVANGTGGPSTVSVFAIDPATGALSGGAQVTAGANPIGLALPATGQMLYVTNFNSATVSLYAIDANTGALTEQTAAGSPFAIGQEPYGAAVDPLGIFLIIADSTLLTAHPGTFEVYAINPGTGAITAVPGSPFSAAAGPNSIPQSVVVDPSGKFVYSSDLGGGGVLGFTLGAQGTLTPLAGSPFAPAGFSNTDFWVMTTALYSPPPPQLTSLTLTPSGIAIAQGATQPFLAIANFSDGSNQDVTSGATWTSSDPTVATIDANGVALGISQGNVFISASFQGISSAVALSVSAITLTGIAVNPGTAFAPQGTTLQYQAIGSFSDGTTQDLTQSVIWSSSNAGAASISNAQGTRGQAMAIAGSGAVTVTALSGVTSGSATLNLKPPVTLSSITLGPLLPSIGLGTSEQFMATGHYSDSTTQDITTLVTWSSGTPAVASISPAGLASSLAAGSTQITAALGAVNGFTTLTVVSPALVSLRITPVNAFISVNHTLQMRATGTFSDGSTADVTNQVNWTSSNTNVVTIGLNTGLATGKAFGPITITATQGAISNSTTLTGIF